MLEGHLPGASFPNSDKVYFTAIPQDTDRAHDLQIRVWGVVVR